MVWSCQRRQVTGALLLLLLGQAIPAWSDTGWMIKARSKDEAMLLSSLLADGGPSDGSDYRITSMFTSYKQTYYKQYATAQEERTAFNNFKNTLQSVVLPVNLHTRKPFWLTGNLYSDHNYSSFKATYLMRPTSLPPELHVQTKSRPAVRATIMGQLPRYVDWRERNKVDYVKDQGTCGSCWAYAAVAVTESAYLIRYNLTAATARVTLAAQQLIDCADREHGWGSLGCNGGSSALALKYINSVYLAKESAYVDTWEDGTCYAPAVPPAALQPVLQLGSGPVYPPRWSEAALMQAVAQAPTVIYFTVVEDFVSYAGGIYVATEECEDTVNHAMVAVGYKYTGTPATSYWIIRNSWSAWWGVNGYAYIQMTGTEDGPCGMYTFLVQAPLVFNRALPARRPPSPSPRLMSPSPAQL